MGRPITVRHTGSEGDLCDSLACKQKLRLRLWASGEAFENPKRTRWLANAEADHSGGVTAAEGGAHGPGAGAAVAKAVAFADGTADGGARPGKNCVRAGGAGHAPQTELAESEAVSGDRTRPPQVHGPPPSDRDL